MNEADINQNVADVEETKSNTSKKSFKDAARQVMSELNNRNFDQVYVGAVLDRKNESFANYQNYEAQRRSMVESHKAIIITLVGNIDTKLQWIEAGIEKIVKFFKDRATQEEEYVKLMTQGLPKLKTTFKDPAHPELFVNLSKAMEECDEFHIRQSKNSELMAKFIRKNILENIILAADKEFKKQFDTLVAPLEEFKKKLVSLSQEKSKKIKSYIVAYNEAQRGSKLSKEKDMFKNEMENLSLGYEEQRLMKSYATQALLLLNETVKMLIKRFIEIQKAFNLYFQKYSDLYGSKAAKPEAAIQILERFKSFDEVQQIFAVKYMLKTEDLQYLKQRSGKPEITYQEVFDVLANIPPPPDITKSPLVIKGWKAIREGGLLKGSKNCQVVVTLDGNVLILEKTNESEMIETEEILKLENMKLMNREDRRDGSVVEVMEVTPGLLIDSKKKVTLKFSSIDGADEFTHYVNNFYNTHLRENRDYSTHLHFIMRSKLSPVASFKSQTPVRKESCNYNQYNINLDERIATDNYQGLYKPREILDEKTFLETVNLQAKLIELTKEVQDVHEKFMTCCISEDIRSKIPKPKERIEDPLLILGSIKRILTMLENTVKDQDKISLSNSANNKDADYELLLQRAEGDIKRHIRTEEQLRYVISTLEAKIEQYDKDKDILLMNTKNIFKDVKVDNGKLIQLIRQKEAEFDNMEKRIKQKDETIKSHEERLLSIPILEHKIKYLKDTHEKEKELVRQYYKQEFANLTKEVQHIHKVLSVNLSLDERIKLLEQELFSYRDFNMKKMRSLEEKISQLEVIGNEKEEKEESKVIQKTQHSQQEIEAQDNYEKEKNKEIDESFKAPPSQHSQSQQIKSVIRAHKPRASLHK